MHPITKGTLADIAMHYYENDLSPLADKVPVIPGVDNNPAQHMVTYTVAFGVAGTLPTTLDPAAPGFAWPPALTGSPTAIDDMWHAAYNGRGHYLSAADPQGLIDALDNAISDIQARTASNSAVAFNSTSLQTNSQVYRATFNSNRWSGDLSAYALTLDPATNKLQVSANAAWDASTDIDQQVAANRTIVTYDGNQGINFDWAALTVPQKADLMTRPNGQVDTPAAGKARLNYLRGDRSCEITSNAQCQVTEGGTTFNTKAFRVRTSALGDIVHSSPTYVGPSINRYPENVDGKPYSGFAQSNLNRTGMLYVGSNDGMLHGIDDTGKEVFGYIPSFLFSAVSNGGLHHLTDPGYVHQYYVDLSTTTADAYFNNGSQTDWHTVLLGGVRGGGKGVFALDVTRPASLATPAGAAGAILWEFTDSDLGYTFSEIRIVRMNNDKWAAVFGNGYNSDPAGDGTAKLFIVYLDGSNLSSPIKLETGVGRLVNSDCQDTNSDCNGLSTPSTADIDGDGSVDLIYAGDLHGNLWSFDVSSTNPNNWQSAYGSGPVYTPLFQACSGTPCSKANRQPITSKPSVSRHPFQRNLSTRPNLMIMFGTGQYLSTTDNTSTAQQSFYGVWDAGQGGKDRTDLVAQTLTDSTAASGDPARTVTDNPVDYTTHFGWRIDFPTSGERVITDAVRFGDLVFFNSMIPAGGVCSYGGSGWRMALDIVNGGLPNFIPIDINNDGTFDASDKVAGNPAVGSLSQGIPAAPRFISNYRIDNDTGSKTASAARVQPYKLIPPDRMSWTPVEPR